LRGWRLRRRRGALGYPREVSIDYIASAIDDEIGFSALLVTP
jgi:hypothetical protein